MRVVILAAGDFPKKGSEGERLLKAADCVVACDSAAETYRDRFGVWPTVVVGDMDSLNASDLTCRVVRKTEQETNDLEKAIRFVRTEFPDDFVSLVIVGATGKREDHTIGNIYRALEACVRVVTDEGVFVPVRGSVTLKTWKGAGVSIFASDSTARMSSKGLAWPLDGVVFSSPYVATLNRASDEFISVSSDSPAFVYLADNPQARRAVVALGGNQGNRAAYLNEALHRLDELPETRLIEASRVLETKGVDVPEEFANCDFLNQVALFETTLSALDFSRRMHAIEDSLGRVRTVRNGPRTIDLDLISFGTERISTEELTLPHPRAHERAFVFEPMREIGLEL